MDRHWMLTSTTYGTWLPGDERCFVGGTRDVHHNRIPNNTPGTAYAQPIPPLHDWARRAMRGTAVLLSKPQAMLLLVQFQETAEFRQWVLQAVAIMANHFHLIVSVAGDPDPAFLLQSFKQNGSRMLNLHYPKPRGGTWWTVSGSKRKLPDDRALSEGISYLERQWKPLVIWTASKGLIVGERGT
jgi:REP element-mobilizing transposase RayT